MTGTEEEYEVQFTVIVTASNPNEATEIARMLIRDPHFEPNVAEPVE